MNTLYDVFPVIIFILAIILLIVLIVLAIKMIGTLKKIDRVVTDVNTKVDKLNGAFMIIDSLTDSLSSLNDKIVGFIANGIRNFFKRKKKKGDDNNEE